MARNRARNGSTCEANSCCDHTSDACCSDFPANSYIRNDKGVIQNLGKKPGKGQFRNNRYRGANLKGCGQGQAMGQCLGGLLAGNSTLSKATKNVRMKHFTTMKSQLHER